MIIDCVTADTMFVCYDNWELFKFGMMCGGIGFLVAWILAAFFVWHIFRDDKHEIT